MITAYIYEAAKFWIPMGITGIVLIATCIIVILLDKNTIEFVYYTFAIPGAILCFVAIALFCIHKDQADILTNEKASSGKYTTYVDGVVVDGSKIDFRHIDYTIDDNAKEIIINH